MASARSIKSSKHLRNQVPRLGRPQYRPKYDNANNRNFAPHLQEQQGVAKGRQPHHPRPLYLGNIEIQPIKSFNDQVAPDTDKCLLYAAGYCKFGSKCPTLTKSKDSHNAQMLLQKEFCWVNRITHPADDKQNQKKPVKLNPKQFETNKEILFRVKPNIKHQNIQQKYRHLIILDLEGLPEIVEFPAILIDLYSMKEVSRFHRYVIPNQWIIEKIPIIYNLKKNLQTLNVSDNTDNSNINSNINTNKEHKDENKQNIDEKTDENKEDNIHFNKLSNAVPFDVVLSQFNTWLLNNGVLINERNYRSFIFGICGNWDIMKQIPLQCYRNRIQLPYYFDCWMNVKDFGLNFYNINKKKTKHNLNGMKGWTQFLKIPLNGTHHLGMDDVSNITKIVARMAADGAVFENTGFKNFATGQITFRYHKSNRICR